MHSTPCMTFPVWQITNLRSSAFLASLTSLRKMTYRFVPFVFCTKSAQKKDLVECHLANFIYSIPCVRNGLYSESLMDWRLEPCLTLSDQVLEIEN